MSLNTYILQLMFMYDVKLKVQFLNTSLKPLYKFQIKKTINYSQYYISF